MREFKVDAETAEREFERFAEEMDVDIDVSKMDDDDRSGFEKNKDRIVRAIMFGDLVVNDNGEAVYTPFKSEDTGAITFHERTGASLMAADHAKRDQVAKKLYLVMGDLTKQPAKRFANMRGTDVKVCEALTVFLMD